MEKLLTESEKVEQLMRPRYKVVADYFYNPYKVGDIIEGTDLERFHLTTTKYRDEFGEERESENYYTADYLEKYSNLFRKLEWWQERSIDELPEFVRWEVASPDKGAIEKALKWTMRGQIPYVDLISQRNAMRADYFTPANEDDYIKYISK